MSDLPRDSDEATDAGRGEGSGHADDGAQAAWRGTSPFDEPTAEIPPVDSGRPGAPDVSEGDVDSRPGAQPSGGASGGERGDGGASGAAADVEEGRRPSARVVSPEDVVLGSSPGEVPTQRIPTYDELAADPPEPQPQAHQQEHAREPRDGAVRAPEAVGAAQREPRGTLDLGLLVIRIALGAILFAHGLQKLTGYWGGPGLDGFRDMLESEGFEFATVLSVVTPVGELLAGAMLVLGLLTPVAAAGAAALLINAWFFVQASAPGIQFFTDQSGEAGSGVEFETMLLFAALGIGLSGPGAVSLDAKRGWVRRPRYGSAAALVVGIAAGVAVWFLLNGADPLGG